MFHAYEANSGLLDGTPVLHNGVSGLIRGSLHIAQKSTSL